MLSFLLILYFIVILMSIITGAAKFTTLSAPVKILTILLFTTLISESIAEYLSYKAHNNCSVYHFYVIISFWLYALIYFYLLKLMKLKLIFYMIAILFTIFCVINSLLFQRLDSFPSINFTFNNVLLVIFSLVYFKSIIDRDPFQTIKKNSAFWFNTSVLIYFSIQLLIWGIMNYLAKTGKDFMPLIIFGLIISILYYAALGISIFLDRGINASEKMK